MRWDTFFIGFEMLAFSGIAFIPDDAPPQICQVLINFIASMQYNTFRQSRHVVMATTFCTNHLRQTGRALLGAEIPLAVVFIALLRADLGAERDKLEIKPHGH